MRGVALYEGGENIINLIIGKRNVGIRTEVQRFCCDDFHSRGDKIRMGKNDDICFTATRCEQECGDELQCYKNLFHLVFHFRHGLTDAGLYFFCQFRVVQDDLLDGFAALGQLGVVITEP